MVYFNNLNYHVASVFHINSHINTPIFFKTAWTKFLKFVSWEACDLSKSPKNAKQREMVLPDRERGLLSSQRWTSCGEENILSWIRSMFVYQVSFAAPRWGERTIFRKEEGGSLCNIVTVLNIQYDRNRPYSEVLKNIKLVFCLNLYFVTHTWTNM